VSGLNPQFRFDTLVVGAANRLAATAARAVAEAPGTVYNPLFIYARPGLGKTHLLMAMGHAAAAIDPRLAVEYVTADAFLESFATAVAGGQGEAHRRRFSDVGLLLLDDVQFLSQRREAQAELIRLIDGLQAAARQIVLASDRPPAEIEGLDERLIRRFAGGLVIDILAPDYETRVAILRRRAEERGVAFGPGVLEAAASADSDSVRELIGSLNRLIAFQAASDAPLDPMQARLLLGSPEPAGIEAQDSVPPAEWSPPGPASAALPPEAAPRDEFADFLSEVSATVSQQVESWRARVAEAVLRWEGEGYRTARLERLLSEEVVADPHAVLDGYAEDVARLRAIGAELAEGAPALAGSAELFDPDNVAAAEALLERARHGANPPPAPSPHWRLESFLEGASNRIAVRAAQSVAAEGPGRYNPFVIVGASGVGKTHLLHGLGNALAARGGVVACLGAHEFVDELIDAIDREATAAWRARYRAVDAFLLDDVHVVAGKDRTQDELFLLFNLLLESGRQMAFTSAVPLADMQGIEPRLLTRLEGGLVVELPAPDRALRQAAIERLLAARLDGVDPELAAYIAARPADSMRSALGLVQRVLNAAEVQQVHPTAALAREVLEGPVTRGPRRAASRVSGVLAPTAGGIRSREKMVWEWPDAAARLIEEWR
jgi:chromosomal replication initiation ATPase DnaA